ncbi:MAG: hypothetical protein Q8O98_00140 [bacterium]|nr:hypothetical protein [bacterium]
MNQKKKKALIFSLAYYPHLVGGAEIAVKEITDRIGDVEFDMITLYAGKERHERIGNVDVYRVGPKIRIKGNTVPPISYLIKFQYVFFAFMKSIILQKRRQYDFTWSIMASFNAFSALFFKIIHRRIPFLLNLQEGDSVEHIKRALGFMHPLYIQIFKKADYIQVLQARRVSPKKFCLPLLPSLTQRGQIPSIHSRNCVVQEWLTSWCKQFYKKRTLE